MVVNGSMDGWREAWKECRSEAELDSDVKIDQCIVSFFQRCYLGDLSSGLSFLEASLLVQGSRGLFMSLYFNLLVLGVSRKRWMLVAIM